MTNFPIYIFTFKKDTLKDSEIERLRKEGFTSFHLANSYNSNNESPRFMPFKTIEDDEQVIVSFSLKEFPTNIYKGFAFVSRIKNEIYDLPVNQKSFEKILKNSEYSSKYIYCAGILKTEMLGKEFSMNTNDEFFGTGLSIKDWVYKKTSIIFPSNKPVQVKIEYDIDSKNPYVLFRKTNEENLIDTIQKIETHSLDRLKVAYYGNFTPSPSSYISPEEMISKLKKDKKTLKKLEQSIYGIDLFELVENELLGKVWNLLDEEEYVVKAIEKLVEQNDPLFTKLISELLQKYLLKYFNMVTDYINNENENYDETQIESVKDFVKDLISLTQIEELKSFLIRMLSMLEIDESTQISLLEKALNFESDKTERILIYYQLIQNLIFSGNINLAEDYIEKAQSEFEDEDAIYEMYGHMGIMYLNELGDEELAKKYLNYVYEWLQFRILDKNIKADFMNTNFIYFLGELARIYREEKNYDKASKIFPFALQLLRTYYEELKYESHDVLANSIRYLLKEYTDFVSEVENKPPEEVFKKIKREFTKYRKIIKLHDYFFAPKLKDIQYKDLDYTESEY